MRTQEPSMRPVPPVEITGPSVGCPTSGPWSRLLNAWVKISAFA
jgi:hypothetical protein